MHFMMDEKARGLLREIGTIKKDEMEILEPKKCSIWNKKLTAHLRVGDMEENNK